MRQAGQLGALVWLLLLLAPACGRRDKQRSPAPVRDLRDAAAEVVAEPVPADAAPADDAAVRLPTELPVEAIPRRKLEVTTDAPLPVAPAGQRALAVPDGHYLVLASISLPAGDRLVLGRSERAGAGLTETLLFDPATERVLARFSSADYEAASPEADAMVVTSEGKLGLVTLSTGEIRVPEPTLTGGTPVATETVKITVAPGSPDVWVFGDEAGRPGGPRRFAAWDNRADAAIVLDRTLPFAPHASAQIDGEVVVYKVDVNPESTPGSTAEWLADPPCPAMRLRRTKESLCTKGRLAPWYTPPFSVKLIDAATEQAPPEPEGCRWMGINSVDPPRAVFECGPDRSELRVWSPSWLRVWQREREAGVRMQHPRIVPGAELDGDSSRPSQEWLDLAAGVVFETEPLQPVTYRVQGKTFAVREKRDEMDLFAIDFDAGTARAIARYTDCRGAMPNEATEVPPRADRHALACLVGLSRLRWTEIIDLRAGKRWRTPLYPEAILSDGTVLASNRKSGGQMFSKLYALTIDAR